MIGGPSAALAPQLFTTWYILHCRSCQREDGSDDMKKGTQLLEVYAQEIQMQTELKNNKRLKALYKRALDVKSAIPHPRIMGIIRECGGKMHMHERVWTEAATDFFEVVSFLNAWCSQAEDHSAGYCNVLCCHCLSHVQSDACSYSLTARIVLTKRAGISTVL